MDVEQPTTNLQRAGRAMIAGAGIGGVTVGAPYLFFRITMLGADALGASLFYSLCMFIGGVLVWGLGLALIGAPAWWLLHRLKLRSWRIAAVAGFVLPFAATMAFAYMSNQPWEGATGYAGDSGGLTIMNGVLTRHGWANQFRSSVGLGVVGAVIGLSIRRLAYGRGVA